MIWGVDGKGKDWQLREKGKEIGNWLLLLMQIAEGSPVTKGRLVSTLCPRANKKYRFSVLQATESWVGPGIEANN